MISTFLGTMVVNLQQTGYNVPSYGGPNPTPVFASNTLEPMMAKVTMTAFNNNLMNTCIIYVPRPTGLVQILKNQNVAGVWDTPVYSGAPNCAFVQTPNNIVPQNGWGTLVIPDAPGVYVPQYSAGYYGPPTGGTLGAQGGCFRSFTNGGRLTSFTCVANGVLWAMPGNQAGIYTMWVTGGEFVGSAPRNAWNGFSNFMFLFKNGSHDNIIVPWIDGTGYPAAPAMPQQTDVQFPNAVMQNVFANGSPIVNTWGGGFVVSLFTNFAGPTGQRCEIAIMSPDMTSFYLVRFSPQDAQTITSLALNTNGTPWSPAIDKTGVMYLLNGQAADSSKIFTSFQPFDFAVPFITYSPRGSIALPCYTTCLPTVVNP